VSFTASGNCTVTGSTVHLTGTGSCTSLLRKLVTAITTLRQTFRNRSRLPRAARRSLSGIVRQNFGDPDFTVSATASSSLAVSFGAAGNCSVAGSTVHLTGGGSCTITASQAGDSNYNAAPDVPQSFSIAKASQTITFGTLSGKNFGIRTSRSAAQLRPA